MMHVDGFNAVCFAIALYFVYATIRGGHQDFLKTLKLSPNLLTFNVSSSSNIARSKDAKVKQQITSRSTEKAEESDIFSSSFDLERRAIFSKTWLLLSHRSRFQKPGDYHTHNPADFSIFLIMSKSGDIRAFHNVCRHRAYKVTQHASGSSLVLTCRYHGWTYGADGRLIKAPRFDGLDGFQKAENGLFEVGVFVDGSGGVWVNLDAGAQGKPSAPELESSIEALSVNSQWAGGWQVDVACDWKRIDIRKAMSVVRRNHFLWQSFKGWNRRIRKEDSNSTESFPSYSVHVLSDISGVLFTFVNPKGAGSSSVHFDLYSAAGSVRPVHVAAVAQLQQELTAELFLATKKCALKHNSQMMDLLRSHTEIEEELGRLIHPAARTMDTSAGFKAAEDLCQSLECKTACAKKGDSLVLGSSLTW